MHMLRDARARAQLCLEHPPQLIAVAAVYITFNLEKKGESATLLSTYMHKRPVDFVISCVVSDCCPVMRAQTRTHTRTHPTDCSQWLSTLDVEREELFDVTRQIVELYKYVRPRVSPAPHLRARCVILSCVVGRCTIYVTCK